MRMKEVFKSNFFNADALEDGDVTLTISYCELTDFEPRDGKPAEQKMVVHFEEDERALALNMTNWVAIAEITGDDETDNWSGQQITLHRKKDKGIGGAMVWCVRVKNPAAPAPQQRRPAAAQQRTPSVPQQRAAAVNRARAAQQGPPDEPPPVDYEPVDASDIPF